MGQSSTPDQTFHSNLEVVKITKPLGRICLFLCVRERDRDRNRVCHGFKLKKQDDYFQVNFDHF